MREKKRQQSYEIETLEDNVGHLKRTNKEMKRKIVTLQHQQDDQTNKLKFKGKCNQTSSSFSTVMKVKNGRKQVNFFSRKLRMIKNAHFSRSKLPYFECSARARSNNLLSL